MKKFTMVMATLLTIAATAISVGACNWGLHQPKEPTILG